MLGQRNSFDNRSKETGRRVDGGSKEHKATRTFVAEGPVLVGGLCVGGNHVQRAEPALMVPEIVHWGRNYCDNSCLSQCGQLFDGFGILFYGDSFTIFFVFEDNCSLMGASGAVHCVRVLLTGTIAVAF